jgi:Raf kinase inhibitor-like YbhB/YbcL family protein
MTWIHWILYNIPPGITGLTEGVRPAELPSGTLAGTTDSKSTVYHGPCPPIGKHRFFHKLYALDTVIPDLKHLSKSILEKAMSGHVIGQAALIGLYQH